VTQAVENLLSGYWEEIETENETGNFIRHLGMEAFAQRSIAEILRNMLETLRQEVHTTHAFVLEVDFTKKSVSILASDPPLEPTVHARSVDNLYYSPARSVVEDEDEFYDSYIDSNKELRYKYFFPLLAYRSCFGLPLQVPDIRTRHALFLLDEQNVGFTFEERERIRTVALAMRSALERGLLLDYMRRYEQRYTLGQLLGSLVHELSNEVGILQRNIGFLSTTMDKIRNRQSEDQSVTLDEVYTQLGELKASQESLAGLLKAYSRVAKGDAEAVDVNSVARRVKKSVDKAAEESRVVIYLDLEDGLPRVRSITSRLEQVMTNLVLNAIQQIYRQKLFMKHLAQGKGSQSPILQRGQVIIQTRYVREGPRPVNIFVMDTGPGIHYHHQQHLFQMDVSTREGGHGLGLFISRNLVESMGGRLRLVDSLMFIGSLFVIEVPLYHQTKE
jgi:signal transduction histidine kinase